METSSLFYARISVFVWLATMFALIVWLLGLTLESLLLFRAMRNGFLTKYALFYSYVGFVVCLSSVRVVIYWAEPTYYRSFYWHTQSLSVFVGCLVVWEIYRRALGCFPGAARMARNLLLLILLIVVAKGLADTSNVPAGWLSGTTAELERNLRAVQAVLLMGLVAVIAFYRIPLGRNLWGMLLGYGVFIGSSVINLTLRVLLGDSFQSVWQYLQPLFYLAVLCVWCLTLWSYESAPQPNTEPKIGRDYQFLVAATREGLLQTRTYLRRAMRL